MNTAVQSLGAALSMKREIKLILFTFSALCLLPLLSVVILTQVGINLVSGSLVTSNQQTHEVQIHDPATGQLQDTVSGPFIWPVSGPVTLEFGDSDLPFQPFHTGIDIASANGQVGDPVGAFMKGTVTYAGEVSYGYGKHVILAHGSHVTSIYEHLDSVNVQVGQSIEVGTILGTRGTTGWSTGPHLHFEIRVFNIPVNPRTFLVGNP